MTRLNKLRERMQSRFLDDPEYRNMRFIDRIDPVKVLLYFVIFQQLLEPKNPHSGQPEQLEPAEKEFLRENLEKHRVILWLNLLLIVYLATFGISSIKSSGDQATVITGLLAPAMVTGTAWYTVSFGGIPTQFQSTAIVLTRYMFLAFSLSMTLLTSLLCSITNVILSVGVLIPVYLSLFIASILYDTMDGLKIGLDTTLLKFSRASLNYYRKHGILTHQETEVEAYAESSEESASIIATFNYNITVLDDSLQTLGGPQRILKVANHLIATATETVCKLVALPLDPSKKEIFDRQRRENVASKFKELRPKSRIDDDPLDFYLYKGHELTLVEADMLTIVQLQAVIVKLNDEILPSAASDDLRRIQKTVEDFRELRERPNAKSSEIESDDQALADYLFAQSFKQISTLIKSYRHKFINLPARVSTQSQEIVRVENIPIDDLPEHTH
jgi:hypothetical protein